ncbi:hypothetical protein HDV02_005925 [Globomyces sp. JEL0801]|nr:hypothetical protein HDV02_005925 [Globomyces sp. JEL0801]
MANVNSCCLITSNSIKLNLEFILDRQNLIITIPMNANIDPNVPFTLDIQYTLLNTSPSVSFFGPFITPLKYPQLTIQNYKSQARWWMPCLDGLHDKYTLEFQFTLPGNVHAINNNTVFQNLPMIVLCSGQLNGRVQHPTILDHVIYSYSVTTPISPASVVVSVGPFESIKFSYFKPIVKNDNSEDMERLCLIDVKQPPICPANMPEKAKEDILTGQLFSPFDDTSSIRCELMNLKSALVLQMMEKRFGKNLLSKLANKIMVTQMSGELTTGLGTLQFLKLARKVSGKLELKEFADQWIFGSGCPIFTCTYNFNRKKMGPITIRVQEPGGTFDTEIRLEEYFKQYDIIYHTKYKRIRRGATKKTKKGAGGEEEEEEEEIEEEEQKEDADPDNPNEVIAEPDRITFEWIRIDPDCVWLCYKTFEQDDFMWNSVLRQDKDICAQYEAIRALGTMPSIATCATLTSILKDNNFYYRLRSEAAYALVHFDTAELEYMGLTNLIKYYKDSHCYPDSDRNFPKRNNFEDLQEYFISNSVLTAISYFRDNRGWSPTKCRTLLLDLLCLNDNTHNPYTDSTFLAILIDCLGQTFLQRSKNANDLTWCLTERIQYKDIRVIRKEDVEEFDFPEEAEVWTHQNSETVKVFFEESDHPLLETAIKEVHRLLLKDRIAPSHQNAVTVACLEILSKWEIAGFVQPNVPLFLYYSRFGHYNAIRKTAIESLIMTTSLREESVTKYLAALCIKDPDATIRYTTAKSLMSFIALCIHQIENASQPEARKKTLKTHLQILTDMWLPLTEYDLSRTHVDFRDLIDFPVFKHLSKICEMAREFSPVKQKLKFKMPAMLPPKETKQEKVAFVQSTGMEVDTLPIPLKVKSTPVALPTNQSKTKKIGVARPKSASTPTKKAETVIQHAPVPIVPLPVVLPAHLERCGKVFKKLLSHPNSHWFMAPVDPVALNLPTYFQIIKNPMDLGTIKKKLERGDYETELSFAEDVRLVFANATSFNPPGSQVYIDASLLRMSFNREFDEQSNSNAATKSFQEIAQIIVEKLWESTHSAIFRYPVDGTLYPEYYNAIKTPIDLQTIVGKIVDLKYKSLYEFDEDIALLLSNCFTFNKKGTFGFAAGTELQNLYQRLIKPKITIKPVNIAPAKPPVVKVETPKAAAPLPVKVNPPTPKIRLTMPKMVSSPKVETPTPKIPKLKLVLPPKPTPPPPKPTPKIIFKLKPLKKDNKLERNQRDDIVPELEFHTKKTEPRKRLLRSLFTNWEMSQFPKHLPQAIQNAERHDLIRGRLKKMQTSLDKDELSKGFKKHNRGFHLGVDSLPLSELAHVEESELNEDLQKLCKPAANITIDPIIHETNERNKLNQQKQVKKAKDTVVFNNGYLGVSEFSTSSINHLQHVRMIADDLNDLMRKENVVDDQNNLWFDDDEDIHQITAKMLLDYKEPSINIVPTISEDPILQSHSHVLKSNRSKDRPKLHFKIQSRYLRPRGRQVIFDFNLLLKEKEFLESRNAIDENSNSIHGSHKTSEIRGEKSYNMRNYQSQVSKRIPKDFIVAIDEPVANVKETYTNQSSLSNIDFLDENLTRFKEVEELYNEIMKSVDKTKMEREEDLEYVYACPPAPADQAFEEFFATNRTLLLRTTKPKKKEVTPQGDDLIQTPNTRNEIWLKTHYKKGLTADAFRRNRKGAMKKIQSSRYNFKYNFGGYIPSNVPKKKKKATFVTVEEYDDFVGDKFCNFLPLLIFQDQREKEKLQEIEDLKNSIDVDVERERIQKQLETEKAEKIKSIFTPQPGHWNPEILDYIDEMRKPKEAPIPDEKLNKNEKAVEEEKPIENPQSELASLWLKLQMPADQKIDMAIKYGSHQFRNVDQAIRLWQEVSNLIMERESLLVEIESFEMTASDPM